MINPRLLSFLGLPVWLVTAMACASRVPPTNLPDDAPASPKAEAARPFVVTRALDGEPPLPGTTAAKEWSGLADGRHDAADPHEGHGHAHHHGSHAHAPEAATKGSAEEMEAPGHAGHGGTDAAPARPMKRDGGDDETYDHHGAH
jgi:hypothetical protein